MFPFLTRAQAAKLDELMVTRFGVSVTAMMELAGARLAEFTRMRFPEAKRILICCGTGNNGGDGLTAARHLLNAGCSPTIFLITKELKGESRERFKTIERLDVPLLTTFPQVSAYDLIIDCLIGYNLKGAPREPFATVIHAINGARKQVLACDLPSGIDCDAGAIHQPHINASETLALALPKQGCKKLKELWVADIGVPQQLYPLIGIPTESYFQASFFVKAQSF